MSIDAGLRPAGLPAELEDLRQRVVMLADTLLPAARAADELIDAVAAIEALKSTLDAFELQVVAELEATGAVKPFGWASTKDFCTAVIGGHRGTGPAMVRLAEDVATPRFAPVAAALRDGWLSTTKAIVITRAVNDLPSTADHERGVAALLDEAKRLDATELRRVGRHLLTVLDPSGTDRRDEAALGREARTAHDRRFLSITEDGYGGAWLKGRCSAEDAAIVKSTVMSLASPQPAHACDPDDCSILGCSHDGRDPRDHGARLLDALVETCRRVQTANLLPEDPRCHSEADAADATRRPSRPARRCGHRRRHRPRRRRRTPTVLRCRGHPRRARRPQRGPGCGPAGPAGDRADLEGAGRPGPTLSLPRMHPSTSDVSRPSRRPLGRRWTDKRRQHAVALRASPPADPLRPVAGRVRRRRECRVHPATRRGPPRPTLSTPGATARVTAHAEAGRIEICCQTGPTPRSASYPQAGVLAVAGALADN